LTEQSPSVPAGFAPGSRVAGYLLEEQIGQGGMAVVFRAHDERLDRTVALKILAPALAEDEKFRQRFIRESRAAAATDDRHIIPVFEAGEASGVLFIAMRFVRGGDVRSLVAEHGPMPPNRAAEIISQVASALDAAHARGLVHRDVKPANILLDASSGAGRPDHVYLCDFGLSKGSLQASGLTGTGIFLGTLDYISPEQIEGKLVDGRADQYGLACSAFEMLTGTPPFPRDVATAVMYAQLYDPPPPLSRYRQGLPPSVDAVFARALAKTPAERFNSCREFADAVRTALGMRPFDSGSGAYPGVAAAAQSGLGAGGNQAQAQYPAPASPEHPQTWLAADQGRPPVGPAPSQEATIGPDYRPPPQGAPPQGPPPPGGQLPQGAPPQGPPGGPPPQGPPPWQNPGGDDAQFGPRYDDSGSTSSRRKAVVAVLIAAVVVIGGGAIGYVLAHRSGGGGNNIAIDHPHHTSHAAKPPPAVLKAPACVRTAASGRNLRAVPAVKVRPTTGQPFGIAISSDGKAIFVVTDGAVEVFKASGGNLTFSGKSYPVGSQSRKATVAVVTADGKYLLVASDNGIKVLDATAAENGASTAILGTLQVPGLTKYGRAIGVAATPDDKFAFVSLQFRDEVGVFNLGKAIRAQFNPSQDYYVGSLNVGAQPVGLTMSNDGTTLYATAFVGNSAVPGILSVVDVGRATNPATIARAVVSKVTTGCFPARVALSQDGQTVWVTSRESNYLLGYSAAALRSRPSRALVAEVHVGSEPVGLALVDGGKRIVVTDTNNITTPPQAGNLAVVDTAAALSRKPALVGYIPSAPTPHEMVLSPDGRILYVTNYAGSQIQIIKVNTLP
jgi:serine/threonine protein kinase/DNA-binding beta-propeller fold protein YncE